MSFNGKFTAKIDFLAWVFYITIADADIGSLLVSPYIFDKHLYYMLIKFEQNRMVQTIQIFELFQKKKND